MKKLYPCPIQSYINEKGEVFSVDETRKPVIKKDGKYWWFKKLNYKDSELMEGTITGLEKIRRRKK